MADKGNDRTQLYIAGALMGLGLGLISAHLYGRAVEENSVPSKQLVSATQLSANQSLKLGLLLLSIVRQIAEFGSTVAKEK